MRLSVFALSLLLAAPGLGQQTASEPEVRIGKYNDLTDLVLKNKGKVVLVDFWFTT